MASHFFCLLAEGEGAGAAGSPFGMLTFVLPIIVLFYFMIIRPDQRRAATLKTAREALKKNDRIVTSGGIYGVVTNVQRETNEVTIKVDEATNTKLRITLESVARVVSSEPAGEGGTKTSTPG